MQTMKKILLIQFREDISKDHEIKCFKYQLDLKDNDLKVLDAFKDDAPQDIKNYLSDIRYVIIGGSAQYDLSSKHPRFMKAVGNAKPMIKYLLENDIPTFGVCFGFQLILNILGSEVINNEHTAESGSFEVELLDKAHEYKIFKDIPKKFIATLGHKDSVLDLPKDCTLLAKSEECPIQAFKYKNNIYGVQFHPELDIHGLVYRLSLYPEYIKGKSLDEVRNQFEDSPYAQKILRNFNEFYSSN